MTVDITIALGAENNRILPIGHIDKNKENKEIDNMKLVCFDSYENEKK